MDARQTSFQLKRRMPGSMSDAEGVRIALGKMKGHLDATVRERLLNLGVQLPDRPVNQVVPSKVREPSYRSTGVQVRVSAVLCSGLCFKTVLDSRCSCKVCKALHLV